MEYFKLNNGIQMPMAGIGVFLMSPAEAEASVESALRSGMRLIDTANGYMNESGTGRGIKKSGVAREEIFLVTKLWPTVYSLWGGSAGARMAAWLGSYGTESFGEDAYPRPAAVFVNYTGLSEVYGNEPPTYSAVGTIDGIASYRTMERRVNAIKANGTDAEIEVFNGLSHGFGLGTGTVAEGWIDRAVEFWERNM